VAAMTTLTRERTTTGRGGSARLAPPRLVKYNLLLTEQERQELDRRAIAAGYSNAADYARRTLFTDPAPAA